MRRITAVECGICKTEYEAVGIAGLVVIVVMCEHSRTHAVFVTEERPEVMEVGG